MKVLLINLDQSKDRLAQQQAQVIKKHGIILLNTMNPVLF